MAVGAQYEDPRFGYGSQRAWVDEHVGARKTKGCWSIRLVTNKWNVVEIQVILR